MWKMRNKALHGESSKETKQKQRDLLHETIDKLYKRNTEEIIENKLYNRMFKVERKRLKTQTETAMTTWIDTVELMRKFEIENKSKKEKREPSKISKWLVQKHTVRDSKAGTPGDKSHPIQQGFS